MIAALGLLARRYDVDLVWVLVVLAVIALLIFVFRGWGNRKG